MIYDLWNIYFSMTMSQNEGIEKDYNDKDNTISKK